MTKPWLSVLMPTYNGERYLRETFESLVAQDERGFECVVVDGGSTDSTPSIIEEFSQHLDIRLYVRPEFPNWVGKTNFAFSVARAKHVCMLHHDDRWCPGRARAVRAALARHPAVALVLHPSMLIDAQGRHVGYWRCPLEPEPAVYAATKLLELLIVQNFISVPSPTFRRDAALAVGGIDAALWYTGDWDFYIKLAETGSSIYLDEPLSAFRLHGASLTMKGSTNISAFREQLSTVLERHIHVISPEERRATVRRAALVSNEINAALAAALHGSYGRLSSAVGALIALGPSGWSRYFRSSRIVERVLSRLRARGILFASNEAG
jgi:glycosyltransferase involved in cell wall biosynthesis